MEVLRLKLKSSVANYRRPENNENKMTYPLPPHSTVIGAIHKACNYTEYKPMNISIQGRYNSMGKKMYTHNMFLDRTYEDRGTLVKMVNKNILSNAYEVVAKARLNRGLDYRIMKNAYIVNETLANEYVELYKIKNELEKENKEVIKPKIASLKSEIKQLKVNIKNEKGDITLLKKVLEEKNDCLKQIQMQFKNKEAENKNKLELFKTLTTSPKYYELLYDIDLTIHIQSTEETINDIIENINNLTAIGRSEDFVEVLETKKVAVSPTTSRVDFKETENAMYLNSNDLDDISLQASTGIDKNGTIYYLPKDYEIKNKIRVFKKHKVLYTSKFVAKKGSKSICIDEDNIVVSFVYVTYGFKQI